MASIITTVDDLHMAETGEQVTGALTHRLRLDGEDIEIDLTAEHYDELRKLLDRYVQAGRRPADWKPPPIPSHAKMSRAETTALRAWADAQTPPLSYRTAGGKGAGKGYYYSIDLRRAWAAHKREAGLSYE